MLLRGTAESYIQAIKNFYENTKHLERTDEFANGIEEIVNIYRREIWFHHVLSELAFLEIRSAQKEKNHDIIPVVLSGDGIQYWPLLEKIVHRDIPLWLKFKSTNQEPHTLHKLLFKLLVEIYTDNYPEVKAFEKCYKNCVKKLFSESGLPAEKEFADFVSREILSALGQIKSNTQATSRTGS